MPKRKKITNDDKAIQARKLLEVNPNFKWEVMNLRDRLDIALDDTDRAVKIDQLPRIKVSQIDGETIPLSTGIKGTDFYEGIIEILKKLHLRKEYWLESVSNYVLYNEFGTSFGSLMESETAPTLEHEVDPISEQAVTKIVLGKNTTLEDIAEIWPEIDRGEYILFNYSHPKFKKRDNLDRDLEILKMAKDGLRIRDIATKIDSKYSEDISYGNIKKIVSSLCTELGLGKIKLRT